ncbi:hypothetical protein [Dyadobacter psychrotolerans]|uniref:Uncharacterized protein n=1 Tax=Dyadobacter psychrotolerans TaxID=2541721 RepID=A0A4R5DDQ1_9BACT|nr:hypothetical protein [Dyadobacter psychrotolerans]TDE11972.1 hypothetical protein E0F88_23235 [Dyadobacter psychrotolerans]
MNKTPNYLSNLLMLTLLAGAACNRNELAVQPVPIAQAIVPDEISVERAKALYESANKAGEAIANTRKKKLGEAPDWDRPKRLKFKGGTSALVIPILKCRNQLHLPLWAS